jgi:hypothetical protein
VFGQTRERERADRQRRAKRQVLHRVLGEDEAGDDRPGTDRGDRQRNDQGRKTGRVDIRETRGENQGRDADANASQRIVASGNDWLATTRKAAATAIANQATKRDMMMFLSVWDVGPGRSSRSIAPNSKTYIAAVDGDYG